MMQVKAPLQQLLKQLVHLRAQLARLLDEDAEIELGNPAARLEHFQSAEMQDMMARWVQDLERARAAATATRRRLILAVHHATILAVLDMVHAEPPVHDSQWEVREKRTDVAIQQLMRSLGTEMEPKQFVLFSLARSRRDLVECEGEVTRQELRLRVLRSIQDVMLAVASLRDVEQDLLDHMLHVGSRHMSK
ncbi:hypothetical protein GQ55_5G432700 [Panicum hallii var. hallii]|uniref:Uncharacterized protein n=1 Tax=Panicum hallii var. hallii TaxID=1504633 RepID=A0A2T7DPH7_9POAL|nr:hypothetical protein GQ55_5G432700 [Panicum hallii var. hallii]